MTLNSDLVGEYLQAEASWWRAAHDGESGCSVPPRWYYWLCSIDGYPALMVFEVSRRIRATSRLPVLLLTARGEDVTELWVWRLAATIICQNHLTREN